MKTTTEPVHYVSGADWGLTDKEREERIESIGALMVTAMELWESYLAELHGALSYDPDTGLFTWKRTVGRRAKAGARACSPRNEGYLGVHFQYKQYSAHRLAWLFVHGRWPEGQIDHINRVRDDNRIANLRVVTHQENAMNTISARSKHGVPGVNKRGRQWQAQITLHGKRISLGFFPTKEDASAAYIKAKQEMHPTYEHNYRGEADRLRLRMEALIKSRPASFVRGLEIRRGLI